MLTFGKWKPAKFYILSLLLGQGLALNSYAKANYQCIPIDSMGPYTRVVALCDASKLNKKFKVKTDPETRCVPGNATQKSHGVDLGKKGKGFLSPQAVWVTQSTDKKAEKLRECEEREAIIFTSPEH